MILSKIAFVLESSLIFGKNLVPVLEKVDQQNIKRYRPISLLSSCGMIFESLIFNTVFELLEEGYFPQNN